MDVFLCFIVTAKPTSSGAENSPKRYPPSRPQKHPLKKLGMQLGTQLGTHLRIFWHTSLRGKIHDFGHFERKRYRVGGILYLVIYRKSLIYNIFTLLPLKKCLFFPLYYVLSMPLHPIYYLFPNILLYNFCSRSSSKSFNEDRVLANPKTFVV